jgi:RNA polymerase sigma-70 factor, ECF subfamily
VGITQSEPVPGEISNLIPTGNYLRGSRNEECLVAQFKAGDSSAFEEIVTRFKDKVRRLGVNMTRNHEDAEDIVQDTFLKCLLHLPDFRGECRFSTWLMRIAINEGLMKLRKRRSIKETPADDWMGDDGTTLLLEIPDWRPNAQKVYERLELKEILYDAVYCLPLSFQRVIILRDVEGYSTRETAEMLSLTIGAVKSRLVRARNFLRGELGRLSESVST